MSLISSTPQRGDSATLELPAFNGKPRAWSIEDRVLVRRVKASTQFLRLPPGICYDANWYSQLRPYFDELLTEDYEGGWVYTISAIEFDEHRELLNRGHGQQFLVRLERWRREQRNGHQPSLFSAADTPSTVGLGERLGR